MRKTLFTLALLTTLGGLSAQADIDAEILTYSRSVFKTSPADFSSKFPEFKWDKSGDNFSSEANDLQLWGQPIKGIQLKASDTHINTIEFLIDEAPSIDRSSLSNWSTKLSSITGKKARRIPTRKVDGNTYSAAVWESADSIVLLTNKSSSNNDTLVLKIIEKSVGSGHLGQTQSPINSRTFYNSERTAGIQGSLLDYNPNTGVVKIESSNQTKALKFDQLSKDDRQYVENNRALIAAIRGLELKFTEVKEDPVKAGNRTTTNTKFTIQAYNRSDASIESLELRYTLLYREGGVSKDGTDLKKQTGKVEYSSLLSKYGESTDTEPVAIIKEVKPASGGG